MAIMARHSMDTQAFITTHQLAEKHVARHLEPSEPVGL